MDDNSPDTRLTHLCTLKAKGLPKPANVSDEDWEAATPEISSNLASLQTKLRHRINKTAEAPLPQDDLGVVRAFFGPAFDTLVNVMFTAGKDADRAQAAKAIIEYTLGKPEQKVTHTGNVALEVHQQLQVLARGLQEGTIVDVQNLLAKPQLGVDNFLKEQMPEKFVVGRKAVSVQPEQEPREGLHSGADVEDEA